MNLDSLLDFSSAVLRGMTPILFAALGGYLSERSGVINIALEGMMLIGSFFGVLAALSFHGSGAPWMGFLAAGVAGGIFAALYGLFVIRYRANQIVAGTAMNLLAAGLTPFFCKIVFDSTGNTPSLPLEDRFQYFPMFLSFGLAFGLHWMSRQTPMGLWISFAGENPAALATAGIRVNRLRTWAVIASGVLAGWGGASLSICLSSSFSRNMTAGRGFMALAALIFGKWRPLPAMGACLFFAISDTVQMRLQGVPVFGGQPIPVEFIQMIPYVATMLILAGWVGQSRAPKSLGLPFHQG
ncbi:MAG: ABC transporter permease [Bdellovibrionales bacterium]|nr:ABC transporter permease [Bdellovibrionales bacterium]